MESKGSADVPGFVLFRSLSSIVKKTTLFCVIMWLIKKRNPTWPVMYCITRKRERKRQGQHYCAGFICNLTRKVIYSGKYDVWKQFSSILSNFTVLVPTLELWAAAVQVFTNQLAFSEPPQWTKWVVAYCSPEKITCITRRCTYSARQSQWKCTNPKQDKMISLCVCTDRGLSSLD